MRSDKSIESSCLSFSRPARHGWSAAPPLGQFSQHFGASRHGHKYFPAGRTRVWKTAHPSIHPSVYPSIYPSILLLVPFNAGPIQLTFTLAFLTTLTLQLKSEKCGPIAAFKVADDSLCLGRFIMTRDVLSQHLHLLHLVETTSFVVGSRPDQVSSV